MRAKMWFITGICCIVLSGCKTSQSTGGSDGKAPADDENRIIGAWLVVNAERSGAYHNDPVDGELVLTFSADKVSSAWRKSESGSPFEGSYKLDASKQPKEIDMAMTGKGKAETSLGIYTLDGDNLKICFGQTRPTELKTTKDDKFNLITFKRVN